jgi:hypothetical protein
MCQINAVSNSDHPPVREAHVVGAPITEEGKSCCESLDHPCKGLDTVSNLNTSESESKYLLAKKCHL